MPKDNFIVVYVLLFVLIRNPVVDITVSSFFSLLLMLSVPMYIYQYYFMQVLMLIRTIVCSFCHLILVCI